MRIARPVQLEKKTRQRKGWDRGDISKKHGEGRLNDGLYYNPANWRPDIGQPRNRARRMVGLP